MATCLGCPRDGEPRLRAVRNYGLTGGFLLETVCLCESCAVLRDDVL